MGTRKQKVRAEQPDWIWWTTSSSSPGSSFACYPSRVSGSSTGSFPPSRLAHTCTHLTRLLTTRELHLDLTRPRHATYPHSTRKDAQLLVPSNLPESSEQSQEDRGVQTSSAALDPHELEIDLDLAPDDG